MKALQVPRNRQFNHVHSELSRGRVLCDDLPDAARALEKQLRSKLKLPKHDKTNLLKGYVDCHSPPCRPYLDTHWDFDTTLVHLYQSRAWSAQNFQDLSELFFNQVTSLRRSEHLGFILGIRWPSGVWLWLSNTISDPPSSFELTFVQSEKNDALAKERITAICQGWNIADRLQTAGDKLQLDPAKMTPLETGISFEQHACHVFDYNLTHGKIALTFDETVPRSKTFEYIQRAMNKLQPFAGEPERLNYQINHAAECYEELINIGQQTKLEWWLTKRGSYPKKFNPFARPAEITHDIYYPVVNSSTDRTIQGVTKKVDFLDLQITVHHAPEGSSLLLHTQFNESFLEELVAESGIDAKIELLPEQ